MKRTGRDESLALSGRSGLLAFLGVVAAPLALCALRNRGGRDQVSYKGFGVRVALAVAAPASKRDLTGAAVQIGVSN